MKPIAKRPGTAKLLLELFRQAQEIVDIIVRRPGIDRHHTGVSGSRRSDPPRSARAGRILPGHRNEPSRRAEPAAESGQE